MIAGVLLVVLPLTSAMTVAPYVIDVEIGPRAGVLDEAPREDSTPFRL
jgi:hypothetical protein